MVMIKARKIVEYFSKSTQQTAKLLEFQSTSNLAIYSGRPKRLLQDCINRWWSTYRMLKRMKLCKPALPFLHAAGSIDCEMLKEEQWVILEQVEITLKKMAAWRCILEGNKYPTGSLVVSAIFAIRQHYTDVIDFSDTKEPVKRLATILRDDFDKRYHPPAGNVGKVRFSCIPETGKHNRYIGVHPYFFMAAYIDPRTKNGLKNKMMVQDQCKELKNLLSKRWFNVQ